MANKNIKSLSDLSSLISEADKNKLASEKEKRDNQELEAKRKIEHLTVKEMNVECFPVFIRLNYSHLRGYSNSALIELGKEFKAYLENIFKDDLRKGEKIWDIEFGVIAYNKISDPFSINGYNPAFAWHFCEFVEKMKQDIKNKKA